MLDKLMLVSFSAVIILISFDVSAGRFSYTCETIGGKAFRSMEDISGNKIANDWTDETGLGTIKISYPGTGSEGLVDDKPVLAFSTDETVLLVEYASNAFAQSIWTYAVNLKLKEAVASQVNSAVVGGMGSLKARSLQLGCK